MKATFLLRFLLHSLLLIGMLGIASIPSVQAQDIKKVGQSGMKFLSIPISARADALGNAFVGVTDDATSLFWNAAGMAKIEQLHVSFHHQEWIADMSHNAVAVGYRLGDRLGTIGASFFSVNYGDFHGTRRSATDPGGFVETGTFSPKAMVFGLGYAARLTERFYWGAHIRYAYQDLGTSIVGIDPNDMGAGFRSKESSENVFLLDFGTIYHTGFRDLRIAMSFRNFGNDVTFEEEPFSLPLQFTLGLAMDMFQLMNYLGVMNETDAHSFTLAVDASTVRDYSERVNVGVEYVYNNMIALRGGYKFNYDEEGLGLGVGVRQTLGNYGLEVDYAYKPHGVFGNLHRFSLGIAK